MSNLASLFRDKSMGHSVRPPAGPTSASGAQTIKSAFRETLKRDIANDPVAARLIEVGAWTELAFLLVERLLPDWRVRRLCFEDGHWHCALSKTWWRPDWLDESAEAAHPQLPIAILRALQEAQTQDTAPPAPPLNVMVTTQDAEAVSLFCENVS